MFTDDEVNDVGKNYFDHGILVLDNVNSIYYTRCII